ncbi:MULTISPECIES: hypothetical protein [unclassified Leifsonia]|uniref:hypothetical protein n=1 Tax=unclassified Leifsonia TaxID=2663824 RepID=UPI0008A78638|nr:MULTISPECIES: hypothetical protein [unclassified Leifsonia]SEH55166.1 hypothetical protein SAMN04515694_10134 [Leifsonia sp. CL154]SFL23867.1 hypothetical protein SAMN04515692_101445 [Leifsonia sp. CL147]
MSADKSARERAELDWQIERVERQEDEFSEARQRYERSLEQFREQFHAVGRHRESSLGERMQAGDTGAQHELETRQELLWQVHRYVEETSEELEQTRSRVRRSFDDELDKLAKERNALPWE